MISKKWFYAVCKKLTIRINEDNMDINDILFEAIKSNASDVHIVCILPPIMRVHGKLIKLEKFGDVTSEISEKILTGILNEEQKKGLRKNSQ